jgi:hypothetical protein
MVEELFGRILEGGKSGKIISKRKIAFSSISSVYSI